MKRTNTQHERQVDIDRRIRAGEFPSVPFLAAEWEVAERTIKRDVEFMRDRLGAPMEYDRERRGYTYTEPTWGLPAIPMKEGALFSLMLARHALEQYPNLPVHRTLEPVYRHIIEFSGGKGSIDPQQILQDFSFVAAPSIPLDPEVWQVLCQCMLHRHTVALDYTSRAAKESRTYRMDPLHVANLEGEWYLFARSHYKGDIMQLAIGRIGAVTDTGERFERPADFDAGEIVHNIFGRFAPMNQEQVEVRVRVDRDWVLEVAEKKWHADQKIVKHANGDVEICFPVSTEATVPFLNVTTWVLGMGCHARVLAPESLKQLVTDEIQQMSNLYS